MSDHDTSSDDITALDIDRAYQDTNLAREGIGFVRALETPHIYKALCNTAKATKKKLHAQEKLGTFIHEIKLTHTTEAGPEVFTRLIIDDLPIAALIAGLQKMPHDLTGKIELQITTNPFRNATDALRKIQQEGTCKT